LTRVPLFDVEGVVAGLPNLNAVLPALIFLDKSQLGGDRDNPGE
jgi:hypothetical protein